MAEKCVILDNGAFSLKVGYSGDTQPRAVPNCITKAKNVKTRAFMGDQVDDCKDPTGLFFMLPFQKGYLVNWEIERQMWDYVFGKDKLSVDFDNSGIILTEPYFNFTSIQENFNEVLFEEYGFQSIMRCNPALLSQFAYLNRFKGKQKPLCCLVVDSGYSFTHIVPFCNNKAIRECIRRQIMVMDETYVINQMKEDACFMSCDFNSDMKTARLKGKANTIARDYVLPDYAVIKRGYMRPREETTGRAKGQEQIIRVNNERFAVPEILMSPSDIGIQELGIPEAIMHALEPLPKEMHPHMLGNIVLTGGNANIPGFKNRDSKMAEIEPRETGQLDPQYLKERRFIGEAEIRSLVLDEVDVNVFCPESPSNYAWLGGKALSSEHMFKKMCVTKDEWNEDGHKICFEKFAV